MRFRKRANDQERRSAIYRLLADQFRIMGRRLTRHHEVMTDEQLDYLGYEFQRNWIRTWTGATFEQYIRDPAHYDNLAARRKAGEDIGGRRIEACATVFGDGAA
jgi:hypothetical protein